MTTDSTGRWFSELKDSWQEEVPFYINAGDKRVNEKYRHFGDLPDGSHYGTVIGRIGQAFPPSALIQIVDSGGREKSYTLAGSLKVDPCTYPMAVASSPLGRSIVWISEGKLWAWRKDSKDGFITEDGFCLEERLMNFTVRDARMGADGILELERGTSIFAAYLCDADAVLRPLRKL